MTRYQETKTLSPVYPYKEIDLTEHGNVYGDKIPEAEFDDKLDAIVKDEYIRAWILETIKSLPLSVLDISKRINLPADRVLRHILRLKQKALVKIARIEGKSPLYVVTGLG